MAGNPNAGARSATVQQALSVVDLGRQAATAYARPDLTGAPGHHAQAAGRPGVPRVRHRRVQAGQVVAGQRPAERPGLPGRRRHRHLRPHRHPLRRPAGGRRAVRPGRRPVRPRPRADPRGHRGRPGGQLRHRGVRSRGRAAGELGRGVAAPQAAQRRPRHRRHPGRGWAGLGPQRRHDRRPADGRRRRVRLRRQPGVHRPRARVPADRPAHVPERRLRADQDRLLPGVAQDPRPQRRPPPAPGRRPPRSCACRRRCASMPCAPTTASSTASPASPSSPTTCRTRSPPTPSGSACGPPPTTWWPWPPCSSRSSRASARPSTTPTRPSRWSTTSPRPRPRPSG